MKKKIVAIGIIFLVIFQLSSCASLGFGKPLPPGQQKKITGEKNASGK